MASRLLLLTNHVTVKHLVHLLFPVLHSYLGRDFLEVRWLGQRVSASVILPSQPDPSPEVLCICPPIGFLRALPGPSGTGTFWTLKDSCVCFYSAFPLCTGPLPFAVQVKVSVLLDTVGLFKPCISNTFQIQFPGCHLGFDLGMFCCVKVSFLCSQNSLIFSFFELLLGKFLFTLGCRKVYSYFLWCL